MVNLVLKTTQKRCEKAGFKNVTVKNVDVQNLTANFKENNFDLVYINCVLMHVKDKGLAVRECLKVLKNGGKLVVKENLKHWLFSFPYRTFSPYRKTNPDYVTYQFMKNMQFNHKEYYLLSTSLLFLFYISKNTKIPLLIFSSVNCLDKILLRAFPFARRLGWVSVAYMEKEKFNPLFQGDEEYEYDLMRKALRG